MPTEKSQAIADLEVNANNVSNIFNIPVTVEVIIGKTRLTIDKVSQIIEGSVIPLNKKLGEPAEISVNGRILAHGNIILLEEDPTQFGVVITKIV